MAAPLTSTDRTVVGALVVTQARRKAVASFGNADAALLGSLAAQASIAIENGILFHRLGARGRRPGAPGDPRPADRAAQPGPARGPASAQALDAAYTTRGRVGLLVVDLDSFSQVVDAFGHSERRRPADPGVRAHPRPAARVGRPGPAERRAVRHRAARGATTPTRSSGVARLLIAGFDPPFQTEGVLLALSVNVGIAVYPEQAIDVPSLMQRAHIAADAASRHRSGWELYDPTHDPPTPRRLALAADLREALETDGPRRVLPAQGRAGHRHRARRRGAGALEPPPPRPGAARRVHRHRRAHRRHPGADHDRDAQVARRVPRVARPGPRHVAWRSTCRPATCSTCTSSTTWPPPSTRPGCRRRRSRWS